MGDLNQSLRGAWLKGIETVGNAAGNLASSARLKVDEMNLNNERKERMNKLASLCYTLYRQGESFPEPIRQLLDEVKHIDDQLATVQTTRGEQAAAAKAAKQARPAHSAPTLQVGKKAEPDAEQIPTAEQIMDDMPSIEQILNETLRQDTVYTSDDDSNEKDSDQQ